MSDGLLTILKFCLIALVYLFLARVVALVASELKGSPAVVVAGQSVPAEPRPRGRKGWRVALTAPADTGLAWDVVGELTIGRAGGCAIALPDDTFVSQIHARIFERNGDAWVEDLGSTNGTLLNGKPLTAPRQLRRGDRVQIGASVLEARR